jgi:hypothetical protein
MPTVKEIKASGIYHPNLTTPEAIASFIQNIPMPENSIFITPSKSEFFLNVVYVINKNETYITRSNLTAAFTGHLSHKHFEAFEELTHASQDDFFIDVFIVRLNAKQSLAKFKETLAKLALTAKHEPKWQLYTAPAAATSTNKSSTGITPLKFFPAVTHLKRSIEIDDLNAAAQPIKKSFFT